MLTYTQLLELREKLSKEDITLDKAKQILWQDFKEGQPSWHSKDWKERRPYILKDQCQICTSKEGLTIQHLSHPKKYFEYEREVTKKYSQSYKVENDFFDKDRLREYILQNYDFEHIPLCPKCESRKPNLRRTKIPKFLCTNCREEFHLPIFKSIDELITLFYENEETQAVKDKCFVTKDKWRNKHNFKNIKYWMLRDQVKTDYFEIIERKAFLLYLDDNIKYLSFSDTITACKKCASYYDLYNMELCPNCMENYKVVQYPNCIQCLPEEKRMKVLERRELRKEIIYMHKNLGLD